MRVVTLGTGGGIPTFRRAPPAVAVRREREILLFDCGEGTQLKIVQARLSLGKLKKIFISHLHGDHVVGLPGLLMTMSLASRERPLFVFGPPGIGEFLEATRRYLNFDPPYELIVQEGKGGEVCREEEYRIEALPLDHNVFSLGFALVERERPGKFFPDRAQQLGVPRGPFFAHLQAGKSVTLEDGRIISPQEVLGAPRPGRRIAYALDTRPCQNVIALSRGADLLIADGMFSEEFKEEARLKGHSTARQAATIAKEAGVNLLVLTHISPRYEDDTVLLDEAKEVFPKVCVAHDLMDLEIPVHKEEVTR